MVQRVLQWMLGLALAGIVAAGLPPAQVAQAAPPAGPEGPHRHGLFFVDYRNLQGGSDGVVLMDLDPESDEFGQILHQTEIGPGVLPHHLYFNQDETRLYTTALGGSNLYELIVETPGHSNLPKIQQVVPIDTGASIVAEDIYFTEDGSEYWVTFMGGTGGDQGGSVGVFDATTNALLATIEAPVPADPSSGQPFILYPHGISANEELGLLMVTSTIHHELTAGVGNTVTLIDMETRAVLKTYLVSESWDSFSSPVEVILLRDEFAPYALVNTMIGGDIWLAKYDESTGLYGEFAKVFEGDEYGVGWTLEFYIGPGNDPTGDEDNLLYVSHGVAAGDVKGKVSVFDLASLDAAAQSGKLVPIKSLPADAGAHHMAFFTTESGREAIVIQNNLLNLNDPLPELNAGTLMVVDIHTGEVLGTVDMPEAYNLMPESIELATGHGHYYHH